MLLIDEPLTERARTIVALMLAVLSGALLAVAIGRASERGWAYMLIGLMVVAMGLATAYTLARKGKLTHRLAWLWLVGMLVTSACEAYLAVQHKLTTDPFVPLLGDAGFIALAASCVWQTKRKLPFGA
jgi:hypothetical protein